MTGGIAQGPVNPAPRRKGNFGAHYAAIPKKSLAVTLQPVASAIFSIFFGSGMRPLRYRRTDSWETPIVRANSARDVCVSFK